MSNQLQITGGAKVRSLEGVITGTSGVLGSVPLGAANGVATLDSGGKVPVSQLPSSVVTYLGTWNAATNTPTLVNGVGDAGDMYICNVAGTVNFGAGPVTFAVGDWVLYGSGTWQKSNGQNGTVTSVGASITGNAIGLTGSPITTAGTLAFAFLGTSGQYVNGAGNLTTFPTLITSIGLSMPSAFSVANSPLTANGSINVTGAGTVSQYIDGTGALQTFPALTGYVPYTGATTDVDLGIHVLNAQALHVKGTAGAGHLGLKHQTATPTGSANESLIFADVNGNLGWQNDNLYLTTLISNANTANRSYTFPNASGTLALTSDISYPVTSVFGRTGAVTAQSGDYTTTLVAEGTNLYYTDARSRAALSFTAGSGAYNSTTGVITIPTNNTQITNGAGYITLSSLSAGTGISYNNLTGVISSTITQYTDAMARAAISGGTGISYNSTTGVITNTITQYTDALARAAISLTTTGTSGAATYNSTTGVLNIPQYTDAYVGTVTSVGLSAPTGFSVSGSPVTSSGTLALAFAAGYSLPTNVKQSNWDDAYTWVAAFPTQTGNNGKFLTTNGSVLSWADNPLGTVTSVAMTVPTGLSVSGSPITTSGTLSVTLTAGYSIPTTASQTNWDTAYTNRITSLTTTGSSGAATLVSNTLNIPDYGSALSGYLPLTGGTLTGALNGTSASFSSSVTATSGIFNAVTSGQNVQNYYSGLSGAQEISYALGKTGTAGNSGFLIWRNNSGFPYMALETYSSSSPIYYNASSHNFNSAATFSNNILINDSYGLVNVASISTGFFATSSLTLLLKSNGSTALTIASSLAATFSSSVTATSFVKTSGTSSQFLKADGSVDSTSYQGALTLTTTGTSGAATLVGNTLNIPQYSGGGGGVTSLSAIGSTPNANGATITGSVLNLQPASASFGGVVTTGTQTFAGAKTFSTTSDTTFNGNITINAPSGNANFQMASASTFKWAFGYYQANNNFRLYNYGTAADAFNVASGTSYFGILTNTIGSALQVNGNAAIGYSASTAAPTNGLQVAGNTKIQGRTSINPTSATILADRLFEVSGTAGTTGTSQYGYVQNPTFTTPTTVYSWYNQINVTSATTSYGLYFDSETGTITNKWGLYFVGGASNYLAGNLGIGTTTINAKLQVAPIANQTAIGITGYSLTGANAQSLLDLAGTWNTTGNPTAIKLNITNTASGATSNLMDLQVGGVSQFNVTKGGSVNINNTTNSTYKLCVYSTTADNHLQIAGTAPSVRFTDTITSATYSSLFGMATATNNYITGSAAGDFVITWNSANKCIFGFSDTSTSKMAIASSGNLLVGTLTDVATAILQLSSTTKGFLPPVMTTTQKNAITSPATGLVVFDSTLGKLCVFSTTWQTITSV